MGKNNTELLALAKKHLGQGGSIFRKYCGMSSGAWCCAFVTYMFHEGDDSPLFYGGKKVVYCPTAINWCKANLAQIPIYLALPMDIIFFDWNANNVPDHIGFVRERKSDQDVYTLEGNTSGGIVAEKTRPNKYVLGCFRPAFKANFDVSKPLVVDGFFGYNSIACLQKALKASGHYNDAIDGILGKNTVKALQKKAGVAQDGSWGIKTSKAVQKMVGAEVDGAFGAKSVKALQIWINKQNHPPKVKTNADKIVDKAKELSWAVGTAESKYAYKGGAPTAKFKTALDKIYPNRKGWGDAPKVGCACDVFTGVVLNSTGIVKDYPRGANEQIKYKNSKLTKLTYKNVTPYSVSRYGDIVIYYKKKDGSSKHTIIRGDGVLYEAQLKLTYGHVNKAMKSKLNVKRPCVVIFRAK